MSAGRRTAARPISGTTGIAKGTLTDMIARKGALVKGAVFASARPKQAATAKIRGEAGRNGAGTHGSRGKPQQFKIIRRK